MQLEACILYLVYFFIHVFAGDVLNPDQILIPERLCQKLNLFMEKNETDVRVRRIVQVDEAFHCRSAFSRTYCYILAVPKSNGTTTGKFCKKIN